jgi:general secretion pathway protein E
VELRSLDITREHTRGATVFRARGCNHCNQKGYLGRTLIQELMLINDDIRTLIMQRKDGATIKKEAIRHGMITFREHGVQKVLSGITTVEELLQSTQLDM